MFARYALLLAAFVLVAIGLSAAVADPPPDLATRPGAAPDEPAVKYAPSLLRLMDEQVPPHRVWVFFTDKGIDSPAEYDRAIAAVEAGYNPRAVERRRLRGDNAARGGALFDFRDLLVADGYVQAVRETGAEVRVTSTWLNAVSVEASPDEIRAVAALPFVAKLQPVSRRQRIEPIDESKVPPDWTGGFGPAGLLDYGMSLEQLTQINLVALHDEGYTAEGIIVGILDTGFIRTHEAFHQPGHELDVIAEWDFINDDPNAGPEEGDPAGQHYHGTYILGVLGAYLPGELVGGAHDASFILCKTEDTSDEYQAEEDFYVAGLQFIEANGGDLFTSSLIYLDWYTQEDLDGQTAVTTIGVNTATANGVFGCTAAGNYGHDSDPNTSHIGAPADAFQVITCGAVDSSGEMASFSSDGPTADGRVKPEVLARGVSTYTVDPGDDNGYATVGGTSLSTPLVACAVACLIDAHPEWSVDDLRDALFDTADYFVENGTYDPLYVRGYGIIDAYNASQSVNPDECPEDVNDDGKVNIDDLFDVLGHWGESGGVYDVNDDGIVNIDDVFALLGAWGPCP
ncbi:MAG: S8 family serine peptidase [Phycisphaerales bacterium]|nr:MAG: S8 family serine peptidase [Phycisphaerales bacterium]